MRRAPPTHISQVMQVGLSSTAATSAVSGVAAAQAAPAATMIGFAFDLSGQSPSWYVTFAAQADLQAYMQQLPQSASAPSAEIGAGLLAISDPILAISSRTSGSESSQPPSTPTHLSWARSTKS
jgi:hypothetical protein